MARFFAGCKKEKKSWRTGGEIPQVSENTQFCIQDVVFCVLKTTVAVGDFFEQQAKWMIREKCERREANRREKSDENSLCFTPFFSGEVAGESMWWIVRVKGNIYLCCTVWTWAWDEIIVRLKIVIVFQTKLSKKQPSRIDDKWQKISSYKWVSPMSVHKIFSVADTRSNPIIFQTAKKKTSNKNETPACSSHMNIFLPADAICGNWNWKLHKNDEVFRVCAKNNVVSALVARVFFTRKICKVVNLRIYEWLSRWNLFHSHIVICENVVRDVVYKLRGF